MRRLIISTLFAVLLLFSASLPALAQFSQPPRTAQISATYADKVQYDVYEADATAAGFTLTLSAPSKRRTVVVTKTDASANVVTVATAGTGATINTAATYTLTSQYDAAVFISNGRTGSNGMWRVVSNLGTRGVLADGKIYAGNASNVSAAVTPSGDVAMSNAGVFTVIDLSLTSEARGDIARRNATTWGRLSAKTAGQFLIGDGTDVISAALSGDIASVSAAGSVTIASAAVTRAKASAALMRKSLQSGVQTVATTGNTDFYIIVPETGTLDGVDFSGIDVLATSDSNYVTFSITNLGQDGLGSTVLLAATAANTTKVTGGTALAANTKRALTLTATGGDLAVVAGDRLRIRVAATGTLANTVTGSAFLLRFGGTT
jgi:hypothetical protein